MKRDFLFSYYRTLRGEVLRRQETDYLQRSITVSCKQTILQIGALGWETELVDCSLYKYYAILDAEGAGAPAAKKIRAEASRLPLQCDSVDMIILPHFLEFDPCRLQTMREVERVLKPEGILVVVNFNPWSLRIRYEYLWERQKHDAWSGHFISRTRVVDWLKLLNFEVILFTEFNAKSVRSTHGKFMENCYSLSASAYAIKAIKRRYNIIPLTPVYQTKPRLVLVNPINSTTRIGS
ncbi:MULTISPECIES: class I SAM-dependent methyltransferase [Methylomicrobium]|jgi:SAM-dependent methyltransferase|uniref:Methylase involved in ubiquinone/menaquinone biosynthesis n=1 Tax=Methylomicrobium album BG8 TaxID=686340 RepID=H8GIF6_METAL|nr:MULTISPECIES: methyltransferase domain-containing protein [Methylomicrobium]EIC31468.1 methylase involved in ubiquinone/menaquinone biosynthesis [Methylomicrobium album BG8]